jgi:uracil phosphoribosyltransferase
MDNVHNLGQNNSVLNRFTAEIRQTGLQDDSLRFRRNLERIGEIMAYEISRTLNYKTLEVTTPLGNKSVSVPVDKIVLATILRAGLPFHYGFLSYFDTAENAFISASRVYNADHSAFSIDVGYLSSPSIEKKTVLLVDPMLATGSSLETAWHTLLKRGNPSKIHIACAIASQQGIDAAVGFFRKQKVEFTVWAADIDPALNDKAYIVPGLGDAGDLAFGEKI